MLLILDFYATIIALGFSEKGRCSVIEDLSLFFFFKEISFLEELGHCMGEMSPTVTDIKRCYKQCEISCSVFYLTSALRLFLTQD